jgi:hypothetical protein
MAVYNLDEKSGLFGMFNVKTPTKVLKKDDKVELKHYGMFSCIKSQVLDVSDNEIKLQAGEKLPELSVFPGDPVVITFTYAQELYVVGGEIDQIQQLDPLVVSIKPVKIEKMKDSRKCERYFVSLAGDIKVVGIQESIFAIVKNVSLSGIKINCKVDILMEGFIDVVVRVDKANKLVFKGRVVRKSKLRDFFEYGIEIQEIAESSSKILHSVINQFEFST